MLMSPNAGPLLLLAAGVLATSLLKVAAQPQTNSPFIPANTFPQAPVPKDAIRVTTLGSGTPTVTAAQVATGFLVELGNGDKFLFDLGTGAYQRLLQVVPPPDITKVFVSHLHSDHVGDLPSFYINYIMGRFKPWHVWGPSGDRPEMGIAHAIQGLKQFMTWDTAARLKTDYVARNDTGYDVYVHEFDYKIKNQLVYSENGVNITSTPVQHYETAGPVAYRLDWNGMKFTFTGDTRPCQEIEDLGKGSDLVIMGMIGPVKNFSKLTNTTQYLLDTSHIQPEQAGPLFQAMKPKLAVAHHLKVNDATRPAIIDGIRRGYPKGDIVINEDLLVFEVHKGADAVTLKRQLIPARDFGYFEGFPKVLEELLASLGLMKSQGRK